MQKQDTNFKNRLTAKKAPPWGRIAIMLAVTLTFCLCAMPVLAGTNNTGSTASTVITTGFANLQSVVEAIVTAIGTILLLWGLFEWGISIQSPDGVQQSSAFKRIGGGIVMIAAPQLLTFFV